MKRKRMKGPEGSNAFLNAETESQGTVLVNGAGPFAQLVVRGPTVAAATTQPLGWDYSAWAWRIGPLVFKLTVV